MLRIYNTLGRAKQDFVPIRAGEVGMYVCGMTVYDYCHLGHARVLVVFDLVRRWLRAGGYRVRYVRNVTDIDDKIIARAREAGEPIGDLTARFIRYMEEDAAALGVELPDAEPRATEHVPAMLEMIARLEAKGLAYRSPAGDVNFPVRRFAGYGRLSGKSLDELRAGERVGVDPAKQDPLDFVLWKHSKPGEPKWPSAWGEGRPGWHIECSAMSCALLGEHFDIHGGGEDLQFPHHENEIAQSEGANGVPFVNYWMHNGFVRIDEEKMSKSLGNFRTVRDILGQFDAEVVRFFVLRAHYRSPLNYSEAHMQDARAALARLYTALKALPAARRDSAAAAGAARIDWDENHARRFKAAMDDDFGTPEALAVLFELANEINRGRTQGAAQLRALGGVLGILQREPEEFLRAGPAPAAMDEREIERRIALRAEYKRQKNYAAADAERSALAAAGIVLEDGPQGTTWRRA